MAIDLPTVQQVARLARLRVSDSAMRTQANKINDLLSMLDDLQAINVEGVEPLFHPHDMSLLLRADVVSETDQRAAFQALAPETSSDLYLVPKVLENKGDKEKADKEEAR